MLTREEFDSLEVGDHVETFPIFPTLTSEPVVLQTAEVKQGRREFVVTYCGITLGRWACVVSQGGELKWHL